MEVGRDLACQRAFIAEAERLHALRHAHLVPLYGVCLSGSKVGRPELWQRFTMQQAWMCVAGRLGVAVDGCRGRPASAGTGNPDCKPSRCSHAPLPRCPVQGILLLEFCAGRDLHSALGVKKQGGRGERLFGWYSRGRQVALDVAKVGAGAWICAELVLQSPTRDVSVVALTNQPLGSREHNIRAACQRSRLSNQPNIALPLQRLQALNYLHSRSIVHLDIKRSNVRGEGEGAMWHAGVAGGIRTVPVCMVVHRALPAFAVVALAKHALR